MTSTNQKGTIQIENPKFEISSKTGINELSVLFVNFISYHITFNFLFRIKNQLPNQI